MHTTQLDTDIYVLLFSFPTQSNPLPSHRKSTSLMSLLICHFFLCYQWAQRSVYPPCHPDRTQERVSKPIVSHQKSSCSFPASSLHCGNWRQLAAARLPCFDIAEQSSEDQQSWKKGDQETDSGQYANCRMQGP